MKPKIIPDYNKDLVQTKETFFNDTEAGSTQQYTNIQSQNLSKPQSRGDLNVNKMYNTFYSHDNKSESPKKKKIIFRKPAIGLVNIPPEKFKS